MSTQAPNSARVRGQDFQSGLASAADVERLGLILNPFMRQVAVMGSNGVNVSNHLDAQIATFKITTPATDWTALALAGGATNVGGAFPAAAYRVNAAGETEIRGALATLPALGTTFATLPAAARPDSTRRFACDAGAAYGSIEVAAAGTIKQLVGSLARLDLDGQFATSLESPGVLSCFPQQVRIDDARRPLSVLLLSCRDNALANPSQTPNSGATSPAISAGHLQWSYVGSSPGRPNLVSIDNIPGLALGRVYVVSVLVLFQ